MTSKGHQEQFSLYLPPELAERFRELARRTRVPQTVYFREAIEDLLVKHAKSEEPKKRVK